MKFSLLVATLNRSGEIKLLLESLCSSTEKNFEVIIVDQSEDNKTKDVVDLFCELDLKYIKSKKRGLSFNRNIALRESKGDVYCFPDDDCKFYPDTLERVKQFFDMNNEDFLLGRIFDRKKKKNIIKKWPKSSKHVTKLNYYFLSSSITMFYKRKCKTILFDEMLGAGASYGSCEDPDYIYRSLMEGFKGKYSPEVEVWHPEQRQESISIDKVSSYTSGFGYFVYKNHSLIHFLLLLLYIISKIQKVITFKISFNQFKVITLGVANGYRRK